MMVMIKDDASVVTGRRPATCHNLFYAERSFPLLPAIAMPLGSIAHWTLEAFVALNTSTSTTCRKCIRALHRNTSHPCHLPRLDKKKKHVRILTALYGPRCMIFCLRSLFIFAPYFILLFKFIWSLVKLKPNEIVSCANIQIVPSFHQKTITKL